MWMARAPVGCSPPCDDAASRTPSSIIVCAPPSPSSPGWNIRITWPGKSPRRSWRRRAAPSSIATWVSWPHACIAPSTSDVNSSPVSSWSGSASMSARRRIVGPGMPPSITATTELRAFPIVPFRPIAASSSSTIAWVWGRSRPISGWRWIRRRIATTSGWIARAASRRPSMTAGSARLAGVLGRSVVVMR